VQLTVSGIYFSACKLGFLLCIQFTVLSVLASSEIVASEDPSKDAQSITNQGSRYYYGQGVEVDKKKACHLFEQAAKLDEKYAQFNLGNCYRLGEHVEQDIDRAISWYKKSYEAGYSPALISLSMIVFFDSPRKEMMEWAFVELNKLHSDQRALFIIGVIYAEGLLAEKNYKLAVSFYERAAQRKNILAAALLSYIYENGLYDLDKDMVKSIYWRGVFEALALTGQSGQISFDEIIMSLKNKNLGLGE